MKKIKKDIPSASNNDSFQLNHNLESYYDKHFEQFQTPSSPNQEEQLLIKISQQQQQSSTFTYEELSEKLAKALTKVQTKTSRTSNKTQNFLNRVNYYEKQKNIHLTNRLKQKQLQQKQILQNKPKLVNTYSQKLTTQYTPIHQRIQIILNQKKKHIQQAQKKYKQQEQQEQILQNNKQNKVIPHNQSHLEQFLDKVNSWKIKKESKIKEQMNKQSVKQMLGVTFTPQINQKSKNMISKKIYEPIEKRQIKPKLILPSSQCTFKPNLNKSKRN